MNSTIESRISAPFARRDPKETAATEAVLAASKALKSAISAFEDADYSPLVTDPLRDALKLVQHCIAEVG